jgi:NADPH2:quinone reductase
MPKAVVCRELGPSESLRLESFARTPLAQGEVRVASRAVGINFPDILIDRKAIGRVALMVG